MHIKSISNPELFTYVVDVHGVTHNELKAFCDSTRNQIENFKTQDGKFYVPSLYLASLTPYVIELMHKKYNHGAQPHKFPIKNQRGCPSGNNSNTQSNRIYLGENFTVTIQILTQTDFHEKENKLLCRVEIFKNEVITLGAILEFIGEKA